MSTKSLAHQLALTHQRKIIQQPGGRTKSKPTLNLIDGKTFLVGRVLRTVQEAGRLKVTRSNGFGGSYHTYE